MREYQVVAAGVIFAILAMLLGMTSRLAHDRKQWRLYGGSLLAGAALIALLIVGRSVWPLFFYGMTGLSTACGGFVAEWRLRRGAGPSTGHAAHIPCASSNDRLD